jgi:hypothetical protein
MMMARRNLEYYLGNGLKFIRVRSAPDIWLGNCERDMHGVEVTGI